MPEMMQAVAVKPDGSLGLEAAPMPVPGQGEVLLEIKANGVNRGDLLQRRGLYPPPPGHPDIMGLEAVGVIAALGEGVDGWKTGDRVGTLVASGGYADFVAVDEGSLLALPDSMSFVEAACFPEALMTVWANVFMRCDLKPGEAFLCQGGTSGIGVMALQMAREWGAGAVFATAGSEEKTALMERLGATRAINYRTEDFAAVIREAGGVDVVLDMVGGDYVQKHIDLINMDGRICNIAYQNGSEVTLNLIRLMIKRGVLTGTTLRARSKAEKREIRDAVRSHFWPKVIDGVIEPIIDSTFPIADTEAAQARMIAGGNIGKIVLTRES